MNFRNLNANLKPKRTLWGQGQGHKDKQIDVN